jgi:hypothetical protein
MTASEYTRVEAVASTEDSYRREWATLTGRGPSDIYIPEGVRVNDMPILEPTPRKKEHEDE